MLAQPNAAELLAAVKAFLENAALPALNGHAAFHGKIAVNVIGILERELALGPSSQAREVARLQHLLGDTATDDVDTLRTRLCDAIQSRTVTAETPGLLEHVLQTAADRVAIEQPNYASLARARA